MQTKDHKELVEALEAGACREARVYYPKGFRV
jgi:hypothetical protein